MNNSNDVIVDYLCFECGFYGFIQTVNRQVNCPQCQTINDIWLDGEDVPMRHILFNNIYKEEWKQEAIEFFTSKYNHEQELQEEFKTLDDYLKWADERGYFYNDLVECDENGDPVE